MDDDDNGSDEPAESNLPKHEENIDHNVECIRQKMLGRVGRVVQSFSVGDVVRLQADRTWLGKKFLPCKVLEIVRDNLYRLGYVRCILSRS